jgi:hypothetical protein
LIYKPNEKKHPIHLYPAAAFLGKFFGTRKSIGTAQGLPNQGNQCFWQACGQPNPMCALALRIGYHCHQIQVL